MMPMITRAKASSVAKFSGTTGPTETDILDITNGRSSSSSPAPVGQLDQPKKKRKVAVISEEELEEESFSVTTGNQQAATSSSSEISALVVKMEINSTEEYLGLPSYKKLSGTVLNFMFKRNKLENSLIIDCRATNSYRTQHVRNSYNIPTTPQLLEIERFTDKRAVMKFFADQLPTHIVTIKRPGHYDNVILYDDNSNSADQTALEPLSMMLAATCKWNEGTKTEVWLLEGGFQAITNDFPDLLDSTNEEVPRTSSLNGPPIIEEFVENFNTFPGPLSIEAADALNNLDDTIAKTMALMEYQKKLKVLQKNNLILKWEELTELKILLGNQVDNDLKCQACKEVFAGIIYQCPNGHCICSNCSERRLVCYVGECRMPFKCGSSDDGETGDGVKIRSTVLEKLMKEHLAITCPNSNGCGKTLKLNQVSGHAVECVKVRGEMGKWLEEEIESLKESMKEVNQRLDVLRESMEDFERSWDENMDGDQIPTVYGEFMEELHAKSSTLHELQMTLKFGTFVKRRADIIIPLAN